MVKLSKPVWCLLLATLTVSFSARSASDPTAPLGWKSSPEKQAERKAGKRTRLPALQSIVCDNHSLCRAILSNNILSVGDKIDGFRVTSITPEALTLSRGGRNWTLRLFSTEIKR